MQLDRHKPKLLFISGDDEEYFKQNDSAKVDKTKPHIIIRAQLLKSFHKTLEDRIIMELSGSSISRKNWLGFSNSNPYIQIWRAIDDKAKDFELVHQLDVIFFVNYKRTGFH